MTTEVMDKPADAPAQNNGGQLARRQYQPMEPVGSQLSLKNLLETQRDGIAMALPRHVTPDRLIKTMLVAANRIPDLVQCTQASVIETISRAAELGLDLSGTLGEAYPVPFNNNIGTRDDPRWVKQCQLIIGYRGFAKLARQSGEVRRIDADVVCVNDSFTFRKGSDARCEFVPNLKGPRGEPVGAYAYVQFKDGGEQFDFMPVEDIEKVRRRSKSGNDRNGNAIGAWKTDWPEMAKKTVFRRVAKWLPLSAEKFVAALEHDDAEYADVLEAQTGQQQPQRGVAGLLGRVKSPPLDSGQTFDPSTAHDEPTASISSQPDAQLHDVQEPDVTHDTAEQPADPEREAFDKWLAGARDFAEQKGMTPEKFQQAMTHVYLGAKVKGQEWKLPAKARQEVVKCIEEGRGHFAG